jgi:hypothetical protein
LKSSLIYNSAPDITPSLMENENKTPKTEENRTKQRKTEQNRVIWREKTN